MRSYFWTRARSPVTSGVRQAFRRMVMMSSCSTPPSFVKNLRPLRLKGRWLAVIMMEPSICVSFSTMDMNIAGVEARPQSTVTQPAAVSASSTAFLSAGAEMRVSWPTAMRSSFFALPVRSARKSRKPEAMRFAASAVRFTGSPSTPSTATPRTSLPFASFIICFSEVIIKIAPCSSLSTIDILETGGIFLPGAKF